MQLLLGLVIPQLHSRFFAQKDIDTIDKFNKELVGDLYTGKDGVISQKVVIYKVSVYDTEVNMYGETAQGKIYKPGVQVTSLIAADDQTTTTDEFGPDLQQAALFSFVRQSLVDIGYVVEIGDVIEVYKGNVMVGYREWVGPYTDIPAMGHDGYPSTIGYCQNGDIPTFKLYIDRTGELIDLESNIEPWMDLATTIIGQLNQAAPIPDSFESLNYYGFVL